MNAARPLLYTGYRGSDDADGPAANPVRESKAHAVDDRRPALRPHDQEAAGTRATLERRLVGQRYTVAEEEDVQSRRERLVRVDGGIGPRHGDHRDVGGGGSARGACGRWA